MNRIFFRLVEGSQLNWIDPERKGKLIYCGLQRKAANCFSGSTHKSVRNHVHKSDLHIELEGSGCVRSPRSVYERLR